MSRNRILPLIGLAACCAALLAGCATDIHVRKMVHAASVASVDSRHLPANQGLLITASPNAFLAGQTIESPPQRAPILNRNITYIAPVQVQLSDVTAYIGRKIGINVDASALESGSRGGPSLTLYYKNGPLYKLLNQIGAKTNSWWKLSDGTIRYYRLVTRVFSIAALPESKSLTSTINTTNSGSAGSSGGMGGGGAGGGGGGGGGMGGGSESGSMSSSGLQATNKITGHVWKAILQNAETVANAQAGGASAAKVSIDPVEGTLTITGTPSEVERVQSWVNEFNRLSTEQVEITTRVYKVQLNHEDNYGVNPNVLWKDAVGIHNWSLTGVSLPQVNTAGTTPAGMTASLVSSSSNTTNYNGSQLAFQALSTLGKVSETFQYSQIALNGHPAVLTDGNSISYLYSVSNFTGSVSGQSSTLTPGSINTGLTSTVTPRIVGGDVALSVALSDGSLVSLTSASSGSSSIQTPNVNLIALLEDVILHPGQALMLSGFEDTNGSSTHNGVGSAYNPLAGGGFDASTKRTILAIVITAKVL